MMRAIPVRNVVIDPTTRGFLVDQQTSVAELLAEPSTIFNGPFTWPLMVIDRDSMQHNIDLHAEFCRARGIELAPHGKTTMAPMIFAAQFEAGAWAMTAATISQVRAYRSFGIDRIVLANELVDRRGIAWLLTELERFEEFEFWCYVDSVAGVSILEQMLAAEPRKGELHVLIEFGHPGGRTGVRTREAAIEVARAAALVDRLVIDGVAFFEGTVAAETTEQNLAAVGELAREVRQLVTELAAEKLLDPDRGIIVSAGGSAYFDVVSEVLTGSWPDDLVPKIVLRSGAYVTHDSGLYERISGYGRLGSEGEPRPAMHIWAQVISCPEPGTVIAGFGKRDAPYDVGLPTPSRVRRDDGTIVPLEGWGVRQLNDHHADFAGSDGATPLVVGDIVELGISHPCTAFDRWRFIPVVDDELRVVDCLETYF